MRTEPACKDIYEMCLKHFNEPILTVFKLGRLIGYADDADDCYLMIKYPGGQVVRHTAVGGYTFLDRLKGQAPAGEYDDFIRLDSMLEHNEVPKEEKFIVDIRPDERCFPPEYFIQGARSSVD